MAMAGGSEMNGVRDTRGRTLRDLRISVIDQCNFRCGYCMPKEIFHKDYQFLARDALLSFDEIETIARVFVGLGVDKLRITGGEPLLRKNIEDLIARLARIRTQQNTPVEIALTTNGTLLAQKAAALKAAGLSRITVSVDAMNDAIFQKMNDMQYPVADVMAGIDAAVAAGLRVKINSVIQRGVNEQEILPLANAFRDRGMTLRFIEFMDVGSSNAWQLDRVVTSREIIDTIAKVHPLAPFGRDTPSEVSERWRYADGKGEVGVISSVSSPFCGNCSRARISAEGVLYTCLFAESGTDLRSLIRSADGTSAESQSTQATQAALAAVISRVWQGRTDRYSELRASGQTDQWKKIEMSYIGG